MPRREYSPHHPHRKMVPSPPLDQIPGAKKPPLNRFEGRQGGGPTPIPNAPEWRRIKPHSYELTLEPTQSSIDDFIRERDRALCEVPPRSPKSRYPAFIPPPGIQRDRPLHHPPNTESAFLGPRVFPQPRPGFFGANPGDPLSLKGSIGDFIRERDRILGKSLGKSKSLGSMEQYRVDVIEMTDLSQSGAWAEDMQKALEADKKEERHTAAPIGGYASAGGQEYTRWAGGKGQGWRDSPSWDAASAADTQGEPGSIAAGAVPAVGGGAPKAFIMHHTSGRGTVAGVQETLKQRHLGVQYVMDRQGNISRVGGPGEHHMKRGWGKGAGLSNANVVGMEVIARNDADVTPAQVAAARRFIQKYYPKTPVYGHGEVNPGHKEASEGMSIVRAIRSDRRAGSPEGPRAEGVMGQAAEPSRSAPERLHRSLEKKKNLFRRRASEEPSPRRATLHHDSPRPRIFPHPARNIRTDASKSIASADTAHSKIPYLP